MPIVFRFTPAAHRYGPSFSCDFASDPSTSEARDVLVWCRDAFGQEACGRWDYELQQIGIQELRLKRTVLTRRRTTTGLKLRIVFATEEDGNHFKLRWSWREG